MQPNEISISPFLHFIQLFYTYLFQTSTERQLLLLMIIYFDST